MKIFFSLSDIRLIQRILIHTNIIFYNQLKTGFITGYLLKTKGKMALGDFNEAMTSINKVIELDPKNEDANILHALILSKNGNNTAALNSLQQAISHNFTIRENPMFMLIKAEVCFNFIYIIYIGRVQLGGLFGGVGHVWERVRD